MAGLGGSGGPASSGGGWNAAKRLLERQEAMKAHAPPRPRGRVIRPDRRVSSRNVYHGGGNATTTPYTAPVPIPAVAAHETSQVQQRTFTEREVYCVAALNGGSGVVSSVNDFAYGLADDFFMTGQVGISMAPNLSSPAMVMGEVVYHLNGLPASNGEVVGAGVTTLLTVGGGPIGRVGGTLLSRLFSPVVSRFASSSWGMLFSRWAGKAMEVVGTAESRSVAPTGAQLLDDLATGAAQEPNIVYRALSADDLIRIQNSENLVGKALDGQWTAAEHVANFSRDFPKGGALINSPWISTTKIFEVAEAFNARGQYGIVAIDLTKVSSLQVEVWQHAPRLNGALGLPYHRSIWHQEVTVYGEIPLNAIIKIFK